MKNLVKFLVPAAVAALALVSCNKEDNYTAPEANAVTIRVHAQASELKADDEATKTYIENKTILWGTGEYMKLALGSGDAPFTKDNTAFAKSSATSADAWNGQDQADFEFSITPKDATANSFTLMGLCLLFSFVANNYDNPLAAIVNLPATQNATATSYDPAAYIMVSHPESFTSVPDDWVASYRRATALNKITLKNVPDGKSIKRGVITAPTGKYLAGARHIDLSTGESGDIYNGGGRTESVEVKFATPLTGTNVDVWFTSWDVEVVAGETLTIVAYTTDKKSYTKEITVPAGKSIKFQEQYLNTLGANMSGLSPVDVTELEDGNYVILAKNGDNYFAMKAETTSSDTRMASVDYTGSTSSYAGDADLIWTVSKSGSSYTIENDGKYLGYSGSDNKAFWNAAGETWTETNYLIDITWDGTNSCYHATLNSASSRKLGRNASSDWFAFYTSDQQNNLIFVPATVDNRNAVTLSFAESVVNKTTANYSEFTGQTVTADPNETAITSNITYSISGDAIGTVVSGSTVSLNGTAGTATVTASFAGDATYRAAEASYTINVTSASETGWIETALGDITSSDVFVIVGNNGDNYAMNHTTLNSQGAPTATAVSVSGNKLSSEPSSELKWNLSSDSNGYVFYPDGVTNKWLNLIANNNGLRVSNTAANGKYWSLDASGYLKGTDTANATRYVGIYNSTDWRSYTSNGGNIANQTFKFYKYVAAPDTRAEAGMSWSTDAASATINTGNVISFTAPTLDNSNGVAPVTYESTDTGVATVSAAGEVTIVGSGSTTIKAIFAGDTDYKPQTVSYTLTVTDNRETVATPTFSPDATNTIASGTEVTISCTTTGANIYYTLDGSAPTNASTAYTGAITLTESKTVKAIAVKEGYKDSAVATAAYTVGVVNTSTEANPYSAEEADALCAQLADNGTLADVYVSGIISEITTAFNSQYNNVTFHISADGLTTGTQFTIFRAAATSANDFKVGDAVEFKGTLKNYKSGTNYTHELDAAATLIYQVHAPVISPNGASFTDNQSVTINADSDASIYYTIDGSNPTASSSAYTAAFTVTETTTVKAIAIKDGHSTGVISANFTKNSGGSTPTLQYTLDGTDSSQGNNGYATNSEITQSSIGWIAVANTNINPWRFGGKNLSGVNRAVYSTTAIASNISSIEVESGTATATVNSLTITVHNSAADAASGSNAIATKSVTSGITSSTVTLTKTDATSWAGKFYRIVYNVTCGGSNQYVQFKSAKFYGTN